MVIEPYDIMHGIEKSQLVQDNAGIHHTAEVAAAAEDIGMLLDFLAPNSTHVSQPADGESSFRDNDLHACA